VESSKKPLPSASWTYCPSGRPLWKTCRNQPAFLSHATVPGTERRSGVGPRIGGPRGRTAQLGRWFGLVRHRAHEPQNIEQGISNDEGPCRDLVDRQTSGLGWSRARTTDVYLEGTTDFQSVDQGRHRRTGSPSYPRGFRDYSCPSLACPPSTFEIPCSTFSCSGAERGSRSDLRETTRPLAQSITAAPQSWLYRVRAPRPR
jgi:hypothetical protein